MQAVGTQHLERLQELGKGLATGGLELSESIEYRERHGFSVAKEMLDARHPVRPFSVDQMSDHLERAPGGRPLCTLDPLWWQIPQQDIQHGGSPRQDRNSRLEVECHSASCPPMPR